MADDNQTSAYAEAMLLIASAEGNVAQITDELHQLGRALEGSDELLGKLGDATIPAALRRQIVTDLLEGKASDTVVGMVNMVVSAGRGRELPAIIAELLRSSAASHNKVVADVRTAVPLSGDQHARLAAALSAATGRDVEIRATVDPNVLGGVMAQVGDVVIDGSVRRRIAQLRKVI